jgi:hypothetical protein
MMRAEDHAHAATLRRARVGQASLRGGGTTIWIPAVAAVLTALLGAGAAVARPLEAELPHNGSACWERIYDAAHLAAHPRQQVSRILLDYSPGTNDDVYVGLSVNLRKRVGYNEPYDYSIFGICRVSRDGLSCRPEWKAGSWRIERGSGGSLIVRNAGMIVFNPDGYAAEEVAPDAVRIRAEPDDKAWMLYRVPEKKCRR